MLYPRLVTQMQIRLCNIIKLEYQKLSFLRLITHFSDATKSCFFKNLSLRRKANFSFYCNLQENHFKHLKLYSNFQKMLRIVREKQILLAHFCPDSLKFSISTILSIFKVFYIVQIDIQSNFSKILIPFVLFKSKFGTKCQLNYSRVVFIRRSNVFLAKQERFRNFHVFLKKQEAKKFFPDNLKIELRHIQCPEQNQLLNFP